MNTKKLVFIAYGERRLQNEIKTERTSHGILTNRKNLIHTSTIKTPSKETHYRSRLKFKDGDNYQKFLSSAIQRTIVRFFASGDDELTICIFNPRHE